MVISSMALKGILVIVGAGVISSAVAVPVVIMSTPPQTIIENFSSGDSREYQEKCQVLFEDSESQKYLFVCRDEMESPIFRIYSAGERTQPEWVKIKTITQQEKGVELELELLGTSGDSTGRTDKILERSAYWADLVGKTFEECKFINRRENSSWETSCEIKDSGGQKKVFFSSLLIIK